MSIESVLKDAVVKHELVKDEPPEHDGTWDFICPGVVGDSCSGPDENPPTYTSALWPTKKLATERGREHLIEHAATPHKRRLREEIIMADQNVAGYEDVDPKDKIAELVALQEESTMSELHAFREKHGLTAVEGSNVAALKPEDLQ